MAITDAQFLRWLQGQNDALPTVLVEIERARESGGVLATDTIYIADRPYRTLPTDTPASQPYRDVVMQAPECSRSINLESLGGRGSTAKGEIVMNNADNAVGFLLDAIIDAREARSYYGDFTWARSDFRLMDVATVGSVSAQNDKLIAVRLRDKNLLLDATIIGTPILTGPNAGKPKPVLFGDVVNLDLTPYLLDSANLTYVFNTYAMVDYQSVVTVRDGGVSLLATGFSGTNAAITADAGTETITKVGHGLAVNDVIVMFGNTFAGLSLNTQYWVIAAGLTADNFRLSLTKGGAAVDITGTTFAGTMVVVNRRWYVDAAAATIQLSSSPAGRVTADVLAAAASGGDGADQLNPHRAFRYILDNWTTVTAAQRHTASFAALVTAESNLAQHRWGRAVLDRMNVLDLLDEIALLTLSWYGWRSDGLLAVGKLDLANIDSETAIDTITDDDMLGDLSAENLPLPWGKINLEGSPHVVTQTDGLFASLTASERSFYAQQFGTHVATTDPGTTGYLANWWDYHKSAIDSRPIETMRTVALQATCDEMTGLFRPWTRVHRCQVGIDKYALNPGDCVTLTYPRYGLSAGKKCRVVSVNARLTERVVELVLVTQITPDYTTASFN